MECFWRQQKKLIVLFACAKDTTRVPALDAGKTKQTLRSMSRAPMVGLSKPLAFASGVFVHKRKPAIRVESSRFETWERNRVPSEAFLSIALAFLLDF